jgi:hypothetical protein
MGPEDSLEEIVLEKEHVETLTPYRKDFDQVDEMLAQSVNLSNDSRLHEPTCPICCSPLRVEAEDIWDKDGSRTSPVCQLFKEKSTLSVGAEVVRNHMKNHKDGGVAEIKKVEFIDRVRRLYGKNVTTLDRIDLCLAVITERLMQINSLSPSGDKSLVDIEKIKCGETNKLMATYSNLLKIQANILGEMKDNGELISMPRDKFVRVFNDAIISANTNREREIITQILNGLKGA